MLVFLVVAVMAVFFIVYVFFPQRVSGGEDRQLRDIKSELHRYSGLNPDLYFECMNDLKLMENTANTDLASEHLHLAIEKAVKMSLYSTGVHTHVIDEVRGITVRLGVRSEELTMKRALTSGQDFRPIYLNELRE